MKAFFTAILMAFSIIASAQVIEIHIIQGSSSSSPLIGSTVTTQGVVTGIFLETGEISGFFIQSQNPDENPETSEGIFVAQTPELEIEIGDFIEITARVEENSTLTQLNNITDIEILSSANVIQPTEIFLPLIELSDFEHFEGMLVKFPQTLIVTDNYNLGRYGELGLAPHRLPLPTNIVDPNDVDPNGVNSEGNQNVEEVLAQEALNLRSLIILDDGKNISNPTPIPYINQTDSTLRCGTEIINLTGNLTFSFDYFRLMPTQAPVFNYAPRPQVPDVGNCNVKVVSFNVLNFFTTIDNGQNQARGADSQEEFVRQLNKLVAALIALDADIFGLMEIENNGFFAVQSLLDALNIAAGEVRYARVADNNFTGADAIKCVFFYKPTVVETIGNLETSLNEVFLPPTIAQVFRVKSSGSVFSVVANHFRYKGCAGATDLDIDQGDGQGCYNHRRKLQAIELLNFIGEITTIANDPDVLVIGDFNTYKQEDPIDILLAGGLINLNPDAYSYVYMNQWGTLDYALVTQSLFDQVSGSEFWHINSDEPRIIDYNLEFKTQDFYAPNPFRTSDHDPLITGFNLVPEVISEMSKNHEEFLVFPNPVEDNFIIQIPDNEHFEYMLYIYSANGMFLYSEKIESSTANRKVVFDSKKIKAINMVTGLYFYKLQSISDTQNSMSFSGSFMKL